MFQQAPYTPNDWYWTVTGHDGMVFSSARAIYVAVSDSTYLNWANGRIPTAAASEQVLSDELAKVAPQICPQFPIGLIAYAHRKRDSLELNGVTVNAALSGDPIHVFCDTSPNGKSNLNGLERMAQLNSGMTVKWNQGATSVTLTAAQIQNMALLVGLFVQATYTTLDTVLAEIAAVTITTGAQIDAAAWPATS